MSIETGRQSQTPNEYEHEARDIELTKARYLAMAKDLKNKKAAGPDGLTNEMLEYMQTGNILDYTKKVTTVAMNTPIMPHDFNHGDIKPILKEEKGDESDIKNVRPITVSNVLTKLI